MGVTIIATQRARLMTNKHLIVTPRGFSVSSLQGTKFPSLGSFRTGWMEIERQNQDQAAVQVQASHPGLLLPHPLGTTLSCRHGVGRSTSMGSLKPLQSPHSSPHLANFSFVHVTDTEPLSSASDYQSNMEVSWISLHLSWALLHFLMA